MMRFHAMFAVVLAAQIVAKTRAATPFFTELEGKPDYEECESRKDELKKCALIDLDLEALADPEKGAEVDVPDLGVLKRVKGPTKGEAGQTVMIYEGDQGGKAWFSFARAPGAKAAFVYGYMFFDRDMHDVAELVTTTSGRYVLFRLKKVDVDQ